MLRMNQSSNGLMPGSHQSPFKIDFGFPSTPTWIASSIHSSLSWRTSKGKNRLCQCTQVVKKNFLKYIIQDLSLRHDLRVFSEMLISHFHPFPWKSCLKLSSLTFITPLIWCRYFVSPLVGRGNPIHNTSLAKELNSSWSKSSVDLDSRGGGVHGCNNLKVVEIMDSQRSRTNCHNSPVQLNYQTSPVVQKDISARLLLLNSVMVVKTS